MYCCFFVAASSQFFQQLNLLVMSLANTSVYERRFVWILLLFLSHRVTCTTFVGSAPLFVFNVVLSLMRSNKYEWCSSHWAPPNSNWCCYMLVFFKDAVLQLLIKSNDKAYLSSPLPSVFCWADTLLAATDLEQIHILRLDTGNGWAWFAWL